MSTVDAMWMTAFLVIAILGGFWSLGECIEQCTTKIISELRKSKKEE